MGPNIQTYVRGRRLIGNSLLPSPSETDVLRAALDEAQEGIIILDAELRAQFMNRSVRDLWKVPNELADSKPFYEELVREAKSTGIYSVPSEELDDFITRRISLIRSGDSTPQDLKTANGKHIRSRCTVLPGGGRLLTYFDVTDLVANAAELQKLARTDPLTGVCNRRHFLHVATAEWERFLRYHRPLSFLMVDIDEFKQVNDRYGHSSGDDVIRHVARACVEHRRSTDTVGRIGGDEFALIMPETDAEQASKAAERICLRARSNQVDTLLGPLKVTVSIGVAEAMSSYSGAAALTHAADQALYEAKLSGRNRVRLFRPVASQISTAAE